MPLHESRQSFDDLGVDGVVATSQGEARLEELLEGVTSYRGARQVTTRAKHAEVKLYRSAKAHGLAVEALRLTEGFEGFLWRLFDRTNEVYFTVLAWDLSGEAPVDYPGQGAKPESVVIPIKTGKVREFLGDGIPLFPPRRGVGGLGVRLMIWESDADTRAFGQTLEEVSDAVKNSKLTSLLSAIGAVASVPTATLVLIKDAAVELGGVVGKILQKNSDDYVDFYEGFFSSRETWEGTEVYEGHFSELSLRHHE